MNDPGRLFDETDDELERLLIGVGRAERSSASARARTLTALGITGSAALAAGATAASAAPASVSALGKVSLWAKVVVGLSTVGAIAAAPPAYRAWHGSHAPRTGAVVIVHRAAPAGAQPPEMATATAPASAVASAPESRGVETARPVSADTLRRELSALDGARTALAHGQTARAMGRLDAYAAAFPNGSLGLEADVLRIDALARGGRGAEARTRAAAFLREHPRSVLAARARRYLHE